MIVDTHIHLDNERYYEDLDEVINNAQQSGVERFIIPGADPKSLDLAVQISEKYEHIYFAVGVHPYDVNNFESLKFEEYILHEKCVAIGECGLDYFRLEGSDEDKQREKVRQKEVFVAQIDLAKKYKKPLIVHIRDASNDAKELLLSENAKEVGGVLHCFNADEQLLSLASQGFYFGIGGVVTFKNAKKLVNILPKIPQNKLLIETDGPYLTPAPFRGQRNESKYCINIVSKVAELLNTTTQEVSNFTTANALKLFRIR